MRLLFSLFIVIPIIEMLFLIQVGSLIGVLPTIGMVLLTAVIGVTMLRQQGASTLMRAQQRLNSGELPAQEVVEGLLLAVGGALLLTPGFFTDSIGFACLIAPLRQYLGRRLQHLLLARAATPGSHAHQGRDGHYTIDGEYRVEDIDRKD